MIYIEKVEVFGWKAAIRGMRNPMNSWHLSDTNYVECTWDDEDRWIDMYEVETIDSFKLMGKIIGENDLRLMKNLSKAGSDHGKYLRMINVTLDITAPLYWWKEFDTYKVGTVANSCSTMHKIHDKEFTLDDFSHEHLGYDGMTLLEDLIGYFNFYREKFIDKDINSWNELKSTKDMWWQMIQLLPSSYNQKRTVQLNYQVLKTMYHARKNHKLDEWVEFCEWCETLPYFKEICMEV